MLPRVCWPLVSGCLLVGVSFILMGYLVNMPSRFQFILFSVLLQVFEGSGSAGQDTALSTMACILYPQSVGTVMVSGFKLPFIVTGGLVLLFVPLFLLMLPNALGTKQVIPSRTILKLLKNIPFVVLALDNVIIVSVQGFFVPTFAPFLKDQFKLSEFKIGLVFTCAPLLYMVSSCLSGKLSDLFGPRYLTIAGFFITGVSLFFIGPSCFILSRSYLWLTCVAFGVFGVGVGLTIPIYADLLTIARNQDPDTDFEAMAAIISGLSSSIWCFGEFIGPIIGGGLVEILTFKLSAPILGGIVLAKGLVLLGITLFYSTIGTNHSAVNQ